MATEIRTITRHVHGQDDELSNLWDSEAPQQDVAHYWLYELKLTLDVDMDTGNAVITHVSDVPLESPVKA